jgi:hypothetical protein
VRSSERGDPHRVFAFDYEDENEGEDDKAHMKITKRTQLSFFDLPMNAGVCCVFGNAVEKNEPKLVEGRGSRVEGRALQRERPYLADETSVRSGGESQ